MKFKAFSVFLFVFLFSLLTVSAADGCRVYENCTYWAYTSGATVSEVNITIVDPTGSEIVTNQSMTQVDSETFKYIYTHNSTGNVIAIAKFYNSTGLITSVAESKEIREQEVTENNMTILAIVLGVLGSAALLLYASTQTSTQTMTSIRRVPEKILLYISSLMLIPVAWFFSYLTVVNNTSLSYLTTPLNTFFGILILIIFALLLLYFYNMLKVFIDNLTQKEEENDGDEV